MDPSGGAKKPRRSERLLRQGDPPGVEEAAAPFGGLLVTAATMVTGRPITKIDAAARNCSLLIPEKKSGRSAVIHVTSARRIPAFSRSEARMTSSLIAEPDEVRRVVVLMKRVCAFTPAPAVFALRSSPC